MIKKKETRKKQNHRKTTFTYMAPDAQEVLLAGDFNNWNPQNHHLKKTSNGVWKISLNLTPGRYEYRFIVDGVWKNDPECEAYAPNPFGDSNSVITLS